MSTQILEDANTAGIKLRRIKTTDKNGIFPANIGGFSYDSEQLNQLTKFAELIKARTIAEMRQEGYVLLRKTTIVETPLSYNPEPLI